MLQVPSGPGAVTAAATVNLKQNSSDSFVKVRLLFCIFHRRSVVDFFRSGFSALLVIDPFLGWNVWF